MTDQKTLHQKIAKKYSSKYINEPSYEKVIKPWGHEIIWTPKDAPAVGKLLHVKTGFKLSLQWHDQKTETLMLISGKALFVLENPQGELEEIEMIPYRGYFVEKGRIHRIISIETCDLMESSTPEKGNTYRLEDDFNRETETEELRAMKNRGWQS